MKYLKINLYLLETVVWAGRALPNAFMPEDFTDEFADADLKDPRRSRRLEEVAAAMAKFPAASISAACGGWSETMAAYRLLDSVGWWRMR